MMPGEIVDSPIHMQRAGYLAQNKLERLPLIIVGIPSSDPHNMHNLYTKINKAW
jgi:hypothetical protein